MMSRSRLLSYFVSVSHVLWKIQSFIWISIILNLVLAVLVTWSFTDPSALKNTPIAILAKNPYPFLLLLIFLVFLFLITYLGHLLPPQIGRTDRELHNIYLENMIQKTQLLRLKGIPTGLFAESVQLKQVFIPLQFYPNRSLAAYPLPEAELEEMRNAEKEGHLDLQHQGVLLDAESNWQRPFVPNDILSISQLWERLTKEEPYAVIQGFLGMGKSTLLDRLTLYMSHNCLEIVDTLSLHTPALIPIYVSLKQYAEAQTDSKRDKKTTLTLTEYMELIVIRLDMRIEVRDIANLVHLLQKYLEKGQCLVMFDGLDEVLDLSLRVRVQDEIKNFIDRWRTKHTVKEPSFNRFLVTSRVAGYDQQAFSCPHFTVAELTPDQITMFLPEWCRAKVIRERQSTSSMDATAVIEKEVQNMARDIQDTIKRYSGVGDLVKNPLLLTLLVIMQQNNILPSRRAELYEKVTESLLEGRNWDKKLPVVYEAPAIRRLSPIAHDMQERDRKLVMRSDVIASFIETIKGERRPLTSEENIQNEIQEDAVRFLTDICERVGIFVPRTPHFFGFFHPAFQEYFAAYHILKQIRDRRDLEIENLVQLVRQQSSRWRMPFLLTVAIASDKDEAISRQIINTLMMPIQDADLKSRTHDLLLAVECLIEAKPATIGDDIQRNVAEILLRTYMDAMSLHDNEARTQMCCMLGNWLRSISQGSSYSSLLATLRRVINNETWPERRVATFTLLSDVAEHLSACSPRVFSDLLPELFKVIGMPYVEENHKKVFNSTAAQKAAVKNAVIDAAQRDLLQAALLAAVHMSLVKNTNVHNVLCMSLQHLKIRFVSQVKFVLMLAEKTGDTHVFDLCKKLIQQVDLQIDDLRETLRKGEKSAKEEIVHLIQDIFNESKKN